MLSNVTKTFGSKTAVNDLSFHLEYGELLCVLGPNGAGKTTTIEMCEGFNKPTSGSIRVLGLNPVTEPDQVRARVGIMLQDGGSYSGLKTREMLALSASYSVDPLDPNWLMSILGLEGVANTSYRRLSGGQKQRLSLALAIIGRPELVFLDEPTAGMDAQSRLAVWELINALKSDGVAIILTTHLMDEAEALADRVLILDHGEIVAQGNPAQLMNQHYTQQISFNTTHAIDENKFLKRTGWTPRTTRPLHYVLEVEATPATFASIAQELEAQDVTLVELQSSRANLEEVFLDLTGRHLRS